MRKHSKYSVHATLDDFPTYNPASRYEDIQLLENHITNLHFHRLIEIGICIKGEGICLIENQQVPFTAGDVQIVLPYQAHVNCNKEGVTGIWRWFFFSPHKLFSVLGVTDVTHLIDRLHREVASYGILDRTRFPETCRAIDKIFSAPVKQCEDDEEAPYQEERLALDCYHVLLSLLEESVPYKKLPFERNGMEKMADIVPALRRIQQDLTEGGESSIQELAELCHCSTPHLRRMFHTTLNMSPKEYLIFCRVRRAKSLLRETNDSILAIALSVGYRDVSGFNRAFMEIVGETPSSYRTHIRRG